MPPKFRELSSVDQFRVFRFLTRGETSDDPKLAAITLDAGQRYQTKSKILAAFYRWWPIALAVLLIFVTVPDALDGQVGMVIFILFILLGVIGNVLLNPWTRPKNVTKSVETSKRVVGQMSSRENRT